MIEKLNLDKRNSFGLLDWLEHWNEPSGAKLIETKINELIDVVNELQKDYDNVCIWVGEQKLKTPAKNVPGPIKLYVCADGSVYDNEDVAKSHAAGNVQDKFAEQRRWIGKICKFWNWDTGLAHYSKLITIKDINDGEMSNCPFRADDGGWYMYCEPVKPDDDIIYKGV